MNHPLRATQILALAATILVGNLAYAQSQTLANTLEVSVFPAAGQDSTQQSKDEAECYNWAVENTGKDPFELLKQQEAKTEQSNAQIESAEDAQGRNGTVVRGAAAGALVGEVSGGDAGESAAIGAAVGVVANRRRNRAAAQQQAAVEEQAKANEQATEQEVEKFMNGFTACLEAKDYVAKY
ncbi:MAG: hypothetical protein ACR2QS_05745 [Woeseiaceae bacterium]